MPNSTIIYIYLPLSILPYFTDSFYCSCMFFPTWHVFWVVPCTVYLVISPCFLLTLYVFIPDDPSHFLFFSLVLLYIICFHDSHVFLHFSFQPSFLLLNFINFYITLYVSCSPFFECVLMAVINSHHHTSKKEFPTLVSRLVVSTDHRI